MMSNLLMAIGCLATLMMPGLSQLQISGPGITVENRSTLELALVALSLLIAYATFQRWSFRDTVGTRKHSATRPAGTSTEAGAEDDRQAA